MIIPSPEWLAAGAEAVLAAETGVAVFGNKDGKKATPAAPPAGEAAGRHVSLDAMLMFAGLFFLAMAMLGGALIIHHGLTA